MISCWMKLLSLKLWALGEVSPRPWWMWLLPQTHWIEICVLKTSLKNWSPEMLDIDTLKPFSDSQVMSSLSDYGAPLPAKVWEACCKLWKGRACSPSLVTMTQNTEGTDWTLRPKLQPLLTCCVHPHFVLNTAEELFSLERGTVQKTNQRKEVSAMA